MKIFLKTCRKTIDKIQIQEICQKKVDISDRGAILETGLKKMMERRQCVMRTRIQNNVSQLKSIEKMPPGDIVD